MDVLRAATSPLSDEEHEFHYNPQRAFPDFRDYQALRDPANAAARAVLQSDLDIAYGDHPLRRVDVYPASARNGSPGPVLVFFHGGY